jgi:hypothetical protein
MSYPSVKQVLEKSGFTVESANADELRAALWETFALDLAEGINHLTAVAKRVKETGERVLNIQDPNSPLGKQLIRLVGTDIARSICQQQLGVAFGIYNCCGIVAASNQSGLNMTMQEQIKLQNGEFASADC